MGNRPYAIVVYGFAIDAPESDFYDMTEKWEKRAVSAAGIERPDASGWGARHEWTSEQNAEWRAWYDAMRAVERSVAKPVPWAVMFDEGTEYHFGLVVAETDWDDAQDINGIAPPSDADDRIAAACEFFGVGPEPCRLWLLAGYG